MQRIAVALIALILITTPTVVRAHEGTSHGTQAAEGKVAAVAKDTLTLETATGRVTVSLDSETLYERDEKKVSATDVKVGDHVAVFGAKLPDGTVGARAIVIHSDGTTHGDGESSSHYAQHGHREAP